MVGLPDDQYRSVWVAGLPPSSSISIRKNVVAGSSGDPNGICKSRTTIPVGVTCYVAYIPTGREISHGFVFDGNTYYSDTVPRFVYPIGGLVQVRTWSQFQADFRTDYTSSVKPLSAFRLP